MGVIIDTYIKKAVAFREVLCGLRLGRGTGTTIVELNLAHYLLSVDQDLLFLVFLDRRKAYENLERGWLLKTLEGYGAGPKMQGIMAEFWA